MKFPSKWNKYPWQDTLIKKSCITCCCCSLVLCSPEECSINQKSSGILWEKMQNTEMQTKIATTVTVTAVESASVILLV